MHYCCLIATKKSISRRCWCWGPPAVSGRTRCGMRALKFSVFDLSKSFAVGSMGFVNSSFKSYGLQSRPPITYARAGFELGPQERFYVRMPAFWKRVCNPFGPVIGPTYWPLIQLSPPLIWNCLYDIIHLCAN